MFGNPSVPPYGMELGDENGEVENYEVGEHIDFLFHFHLSTSPVVTSYKNDCENLTRNLPGTAESGRETRRGETPWFIKI